MNTIKPLKIAIHNIYLEKGKKNRANTFPVHHTQPSSFETLE